MIQVFKKVMKSNQIEEESINNDINEYLQKIVKGTSIIVLGTIIGMFLGFLQKVVIARYFTQSEYGTFSLAYAILIVFTAISALGLPQGTVRQIAYYQGKKDAEKVNRIIKYSILISLVSGITFTLILYITSDFISLKIFNDPNLGNILRLFSIALSFLVIIKIFASIFLGFGDSKPKVYFDNIFYNGIFLLFMIPIVLFNLSFSVSIFAFTFSIIITCIIFVIFFFKKISISFRKKESIKEHFIFSELLTFSIPLFIASMLSLIIGVTGTLMLGYFKTPAIVGLYNGALPLAQLITAVFASMGFIYIPIVSQLYSKNQLGGLKRTYQITTKWIFLVTFLIFLILFLFPETMLNFFFGSNFIQAASTLRILSFGCMLNSSFGLNGETLISIGATKDLMYANIFGAFSNIILNFILIPIYGIIGAAISFTISFTFANIIVSIKLYYISKTHFFTKNYMKLIGVSIGLLFFIYTLTYSINITYLFLPIIFIFCIFLYFLILLLIKGFDREDINLLLAIEKRMGVNLNPIKKLLLKFL